MHHKNSVRINVYLAKYFRYRKSSYSTTRIRVNELSNLNRNTQNLSILVRYANFYVKNLRKNNDKMTQFHWSIKSRDSCPTNLVPRLFPLCEDAEERPWLELVTCHADFAW